MRVRAVVQFYAASRLKVLGADPIKTLYVSILSGRMGPYAIISPRPSPSCTLPAGLKRPGLLAIKDGFDAMVDALVQE